MSTGIRGSGGGGEMAMGLGHGLGRRAEEKKELPEKSPRARALCARRGVTGRS